MFIAIYDTNQSEVLYYQGIATLKFIDYNVAMTFILIIIIIIITNTLASSSAVAMRPSDAPCLSVVNINSIMPRAPSFIIIVT